MHFYLFILHHVYLSGCLSSSFSSSPFPLSLSFPSLPLLSLSLPLPLFLSLSLSLPLSLSLHYIGVYVCCCVTFSPPTHSCYGCGLLMSPPLSLSLWYVMFCVCYSISLVILSKMTPSLRSSSVIILFLPFHYTFPPSSHTHQLLFIIYCMMTLFILPSLSLLSYVLFFPLSLSLSFSPNSLLFSSFPLPPSPSRTQSLLLIML